MLSYDDVLHRVRKEYPNWLIRISYEFDGCYCFWISEGKEYIEDDYTTLTITINRKTGEKGYITDRELFKMLKTEGEYERFREAQYKSKPVDITQEQFNKIVEDWKELD